MQVRYDLVVDFAFPTKSNTIIVSENDTNSRCCHFTLMANKVPLSMADVNVATVRGVKDDGSVIFGEATILEDSEGNKLNEVEYVLPAAITDAAANVTMTITLLSTANEQLTSFEFYVKVRNALYNEDDYVSQSDLDGFQDLLNRCMTAVEKIEAMTENTALPNPYPLRLLIEGLQVNYTGEETKEVTLQKMAYISDSYDPETSVDESAAAAAATSEANALGYSQAAALSADNASGYALAANTAKGLAEGYATSANQAKGQAEGYATQAQQAVAKLNLPTTAGTYNLVVTLVDNVPTYSWVLVS